MKQDKGVLGSAGIKRLANYAFLLVAVLIALWFFWGSGKDKASAPGAGPRQMMEADAPLVKVQEVAAKEITGTREYIGLVEAIDSVDLVARVSGYLESIDFIEGRSVKAGDLMFTIEKDRFKAEIEARKGTVLQIQANLVEAEKYLQRMQSARAGSVPEKDIEAAQRNVSFYSAQLVSAKASLELAEIDLKYTTVRAPISGRVTKKNYSAGDYVGPNSGTIASVISIDPVRVVCSMSEVEYLNLVEHAGSSPEKIFRPTLRLTNGRLYQGHGEWDFADTRIDSSTGTISLRSRYVNTDGVLIPGGYVTVMMTPVKEEVLPLVPQAAVMEGSDGSYVYVVEANDIARTRIIRKRSVSGQDWIIENGIKPGETVIVEGIQKVRPGQTVKISGITTKTAPASGNK
ncbi:MAG: efflux RND transporter periplasmic adaptor subunit [Deltaproteobacteria bacterium]|nr:efflux RND transporter periplasmic adaptor subunit [Deltaproteobacteria bacterium]